MRGLFSIDLEPGRARVRQRLLESSAAAHARTGRMPVSMFASDNQRSFWRRLIQPIPAMTDNTNVHVVPTPDGWLAMTETPVQQLIDGDSLRIKRRVEYDDALGKASMMLAHPEHDREAGALVNLAIKAGSSVTITPYSQRLGGYERRPIGTITMKELPYIHSFALTPTKVVVIAPPLRANALSLLWSNAGYIEHFRFRPERATDVFVVDRRTGVVRQLEADPFFFFHTVHAHDDGDDVVVDLCAYEDASLIQALGLPGLGKSPLPPSRLSRLRVPASGARASLERLDGGPLEFASVNRGALSGGRPSLVFGAEVTAGEHGMRSTVRRIDLRGGAERRFCREHVVYGEPVLVRRPGSGVEDDAVLLAVGSDLVRRKAELVVLDARDLSPLATARLPIALPLGFHGSFARA